MSGLTIKTENQGEIFIVRLVGEIGLSEEYRFRQEMDGAFKEAPAKLVVDLQEITLLSSYGIAALVKLWKQQQGFGGLFCIICPHNHVYDSLLIAGTDKLIPIFTEEKQAIKFCEKS